MFGAAMVIVGMLSGLPSGDEVVLRGPYLQLSHEHGVSVLWRTVDERASRVWYGASPDQLSMVAMGDGVGTEHEVEIQGLDAGETYYYAIGDADGVLAGGDGQHYFRTHPAVGTRERVRIWAIGDSGTANSDARAVRDAFLGYGPGTADVWVTMGDNAYLLGTDAEHQRAVFDMYPMIMRNMAMWPTYGNHDSYSADAATGTGVYFDVFAMPRDGRAGGVASGTEAYYSFDYGNVHFVCLDSSESDRTPGSAMLSWLAQDLAATDQDWLIGVWHHPAYSDGHNSDEELESIEVREHILPIMEAAGADLVIVGHSHTLERSMLLNGHYGESRTFDLATMALDDGDGRFDSDGAYAKAHAGLNANEGTVYVVAGSSGRLDAGDYDHPANNVNVNELGSMVIEVEGDRLDAVFLNDEGDVRDRFSITKGIGACAADFAPDGRLDFFDVSAFIEGLNGRSIAADMNSDGEWNFFDVSAFLIAFNAGCP
ncbi:MAG: metallophosphoesterase [Phycisphaerales bacterium]